MSSSRLPPAGGGGRLPTSGAGGGGRIPLVSPLVGRGRTALSGGQQVPGAPQDAQNNADPLGNNNHPNGAPNNNGAGAVNVEANGNEQAAARDAPAQNIDADTGPPQNNNAGGRQGAQPPAAVNGAVNNDADGEEFLSVNECPICTLPAYPPTALGEQSMQAICIPCLAQWAHTSNPHRYGNQRNTFRHPTSSEAFPRDTYHRWMRLLHPQRMRAIIQERRRLGLDVSHWDPLLTLNSIENSSIRSAKL
jgi:hypothetical protein